MRAERARRGWRLVSGRRVFGQWSIPQREVFDFNLYNPSDSGSEEDEHDDLPRGPDTAGFPVRREDHR